MKIGITERGDGYEFRQVARRQAERASWNGPMPLWMNAV